jgi:hypothetical protein
MWKWLYYYLILILITAFLVIWIVIVNNNNSSSDKVIKYQQFETGDLLFVKYNNSLGKFMKIWSGSPWTHVAMIYVDPNHKIYVMETANYNKYKGVLFLPYNQWLKLNKNCEIGIMQLKSQTEFDRDIILKNFEQLTNKKLDTFGISWLRLLTKKPYKTISDRENITCYELVVHLLQESNIAEKKHSPSSYFPKNIIEGDLKLKPNFYFTQLCKIEK